MLGTLLPIQNVNFEFCLWFLSRTHEYCRIRVDTPQRRSALYTHSMTVFLPRRFEQKGEIFWSRKNVAKCPKQREPTPPLLCSPQRNMTKYDGTTWTNDKRTDYTRLRSPYRQPRNTETNTTGDRIHENFHQVAVTTNDTLALEGSASTIIPDNNATDFFYCRSGRRGTNAVYTNVLNWTEEAVRT